MGGRWAASDGQNGKSRPGSAERLTSATAGLGGRLLIFGVALSCAVFANLSWKRFLAPLKLMLILIDKNLSTIESNC